MVMMMVEIGGTKGEVQRRERSEEETKGCRSQRAAFLRAVTLAYSVVADMVFV